MLDHEILMTLQGAVKLAVAASIIPDLPIAFVDITFIPPDDQKYLELVFIPNNSDGDFWGEEQNYEGMFRIILHWPNNNQGPYTAMQSLASIASYFSKGRLLSGVQIVGKPNFMGSLAQGKEMLYPAGLRYQRFAAT